MTVEYDGTEFAGWQRQRHARTVQGVLEAALSEIAGHPVSLLAAGRTDAGVHALGQCANFRTRCALSAERFRVVVNRILPRSVRIRDMREAHPNFHATCHAKGKLYRYVIRNAPEHSVFDRHFHYLETRPLSTAAMRRAARPLVGTHDFSAFRDALGADRDPVRTVRAIRVRRRGTTIAVEVEGESFLYHMVRILAGTLLYAGLGKFSAADVEAVLKGRDRRRAGPTLPPQGLFLVRVSYPRTFPPVATSKVPPAE